MLSGATSCLRNCLLLNLQFLFADIQCHHAVAQKATVCEVTTGD